MKRYKRPIRQRARIVINYLIGEWYCRRFHRPLFSSIGGIGGTDVWGRRQREYYGLRCVKCSRHWEKRGEPKPLTPEQEQACAQAFGSMWRGRGRQTPGKGKL